MNSMTPLVALPRPGALDAFLRRRLLAQLAPHARRSPVRT